MPKVSAYVVLVLCLLASCRAWAQATVNESLETITLYVDVNKGSDSNPGTQSQPLKTIGAATTMALNNKMSNLGTKVIINPGTYKETLSLTGKAKQSSLPITLQAATNGTVFVSGAQQFTGWTAYSGNSKMYTTAWPYNWPVCALDTGNVPPEMPIVLRQEMIVVNGVPLTQVLSLSQMLYPGTFFADSNSGQVYVWPPSGTNMATADVEVPVNSTLLSITSAGSNNLNGIVIRGLTFEYANSCHAAEAVYVQGTVTNILFDSDTFVWNNAQGIAIGPGSQNITIMNSTSKHNGGAGFDAQQVKNILWQNDVASYNNWRGAQGAFYEWGTGGAHIFSDHGETISGFTATFNQTHSIHWDTDDINISVSSFLASNNMLGVLLEKNEGPLTFTNNNFCTTLGTSTANAGGFVLRDSENVTINSNTFYDAAGSQLQVTGVAGGFVITNWETGQPVTVVTKNISMNQNVFDAVPGQQLFKDGYLGGSDWSTFVTTLKSDHNTWWNATDPKPYTVPTPVSGTTIDWQQWQSSTSQDQHSTFSAPATNPATACAVTAEGPDYWFLADNGVLTTDSAGHAIINLTTIPLGGMTGTVTLSVDGVSSIPGASATFSSSSITTSGNSVLTFNAGSSTPPGTYVITALANTGSTTRTVALQITVPASSLRLSSSSLTFSNQPVGTTSAAQNVTVTNSGSNAISIHSITSNYGFAQTNTCGSSIAAGKSCTISVTFSPKQMVTYSGNVTINDSDPTSPQIISLTGTTVGAPAVTFSQKNVSFGTEIYGKPSAPQAVTLTNSGTASLTISSISVSGTDNKDFTQINNCGASLSAGANCVINATFNPTFTGSRTADLSFADNAPASPQTVTLSGTGQKALTVSPKSLGYGNIKVGSSATQTVTLTNASTAALSVTSLSFTGSNSGDFSETNTCNGSVAGNQSCTASVTFKPKATGSRGSTLNVKDSDPTSPQTVTLAGSGK